MRKITLVLLITIFLGGCGSVRDSSTPNSTIYFIDHDLMTLIGVPVHCDGETVSDKACSMIKKITDGQDFNRKIKRQIPNLPNEISVVLEGDCAVVNLSDKIVQSQDKSRICEKLTVYQIVNSLTSIDGIDCVRFTFDNKEQKDFLGFLDMRETFTYKELTL